MKSMISVLLLTATALAQPTPNGDVYIANTCDHPLTMAVSWEDPLDGWRTEGWWTFGASETSSLTSEDGQIRTENGFLYVYGEATDDSRLVWEADTEQYQETIDGATYNMVEIELQAEDDGSWILPMSCEGL